MRGARSFYLFSAIRSEGSIEIVKKFDLDFYFRATLGVKEVLQSSKNSTSIFYEFRFYITPIS